MLYVSIPVGEYVQVGSSRIHNANKHAIRVAIEAPSAIIIMRQRLIERLQQEQETARLAEVELSDE